ncbi:unnamed protein product [Amoebophrya sp. A120]|nr:unnamed protein product [Amoebophrya sp. A120]|eukprot:GSA120T00018473001.1
MSLHEVDSAISPKTLMRSGTFVEALGIVILLHGVLYALMQRHVPEPYMDELFHVPQAQRFCNATRLEDVQWDPKITTPPGIYLAAATASSALAGGSKLFGLVGDVELTTVCSVGFLRGINALAFGPLCFVVLVSILTTLHHGSSYCGSWKDGSGRSEITTTEAGSKAAEKTTASAGEVLIPAVILRALRGHLLFVSFFYHFIFYTETLSTLLLLLMLKCHLERHTRAAGVFGCASLFARQLNIVWVFAAALADLLTEARLTSMADVTAHVRSFAGMRLLIGKCSSIAIRRLPLHIAAGVGFLTFVKWNNGQLALGHQEFHQISPHLAMLLYLGVLLPTLGFFFPRNVEDYYRTGSITKTFELLKEDFLTAETAALTLKIWVFFSLCSTLVLAHPFLLADNRHLSFYAWRRVFSKPPLRIVACPLAATAATLLYLGGRAGDTGGNDEKEKKTTKSEDDASGKKGDQQAAVKTALLTARELALGPYRSQLFVFGFCTVLSLAALPLLEFRYFLVPLLCLTLAHPMQSVRTELLGLVLSFGLTSGVWVLFLGKTFADEQKWGPGLQRIML